MMLPPAADLMDCIRVWTPFTRMGMAAHKVCWRTASRARLEPYGEVGQRSSFEVSVHGRINENILRTEWHCVSLYRAQHKYTCLLVGFFDFTKKCELEK